MDIILFDFITHTLDGKWYISNLPLEVYEAKGYFRITERQLEQYKNRLNNQKIK